MKGKLIDKSQLEICEVLGISGLLKEILTDHKAQKLMVYRKIISTNKMNITSNNELHNYNVWEDQRQQ